MISIRDARSHERLIQGIAATYPLVNGLGTLASSRLAGMLVPRSDDVVWAEVAGQPCAVPLNDLVGRALFMFGDLDRKVSRTMTALIRPGDTVIDVGANLGVATLTAAQAVGPTGRVIAFEPSPATLRYLRATLAAIRTAPVTLYDCALGAVAGPAEFAAISGNAGQSAMRSVLAPGTSPDSVHMVTVRRLGDVLRDEGIRRISLLKLDVEGFEHAVLEGLFGVDGAPHPDAIVIESHRPHDDPALRLLRDEGYAVTGLASQAALRLKEVDSTDPLFGTCHDFVARRRT
jgi:FkbM family methyltransferase